MIHSQDIQCPHCQSNDLVKNGKAPDGTQHWRCKVCKKNFRLEYRYNACRKGIKEKIIEMTLNSSGVRDTGRVLGISKDTVVAVLKKNATNEPLLSYYGGKRQPQKLGSRNKVQ